MRPTAHIKKTGSALYTAEFSHAIYDINARVNEGRERFGGKRSRASTEYYVGAWNAASNRHMCLTWVTGVGYGIAPKAPGVEWKGLERKFS